MSTAGLMGTGRFCFPLPRVRCIAGTVLPHRVHNPFLLPCWRPCGMLSFPHLKNASFFLSRQQMPRPFQMCANSSCWRSLAVDSIPWIFIIPLSFLPPNFSLRCLGVRQRTKNEKTCYQRNTKKNKKWFSETICSKRTPYRRKPA